MSTHTPGPWQWIEDTLYGPPNKSGYGPDGREAIVETDSGYYPPKGLDRNLIAAAPDLFAACIGTMLWIELQHPNDHDCVIANVLRAAIAKAEGGAHV